MKQPEGFVVEGCEVLVCKLNQSLYGLKQSPRCWNFTLNTHLKKPGFVQCNSDPCIYVAIIEELMVIGVYVDEIAIGCKSIDRLEDVKGKLCSQFSMKDLGRLRHFLGLKIVLKNAMGEVWIGQPAYTN